jgi:hypothetical protein
MPYAEGGWLWNSDVVWIYNKDPFSQFSEIIYVEDPDTGGYLGVVSLIKRRGLVRVPYVAKVMLIHGNGRYEWLTPEQAEKDPRLENIQLTPEWLAKRKCLAYGWREGPFTATFTKKGRIDVQSSVINTENAAPYHLETDEGMMWYTPFAPRQKESLKGMCMEASGEIGGSVSLWQLPGDQAWKGVDALATQIKAAPRPRDINWLRVSSVEGGEARSGDTDIIELLPCPREEDGKVVLYACGYVAFDPPKTTRFYTTINIQTLEVLQDVYTADDINRWLQGEVALSPMQGVTTGLEPQREELDTLDSDCANPNSLSEEQLVRCIRIFAEELERRK